MTSQRKKIEKDLTMFVFLLDKKKFHDIYISLEMYYYDSDNQFESDNRMNELITMILFLEQKRCNYFLTFQDIDCDWRNYFDFDNLIGSARVYYDQILEQKMNRELQRYLMFYWDLMNYHFSKPIILHIYLGNKLINKPVIV